MKLILTADVSNLGAPGDVVEVKDGYGRNYLLPASWPSRPPVARRSRSPRSASPAIPGRSVTSGTPRRLPPRSRGGLRSHWPPGRRRQRSVVRLGHPAEVVAALRAAGARSWTAARCRWPTRSRPSGGTPCPSGCTRRSPRSSSWRSPPPRDGLSWSSLTGRAPARSTVTGAPSPSWRRGHRHVRDRYAMPVEPCDLDHRPLTSDY